MPDSGNERRWPGYRPGQGPVNFDMIVTGDGQVLNQDPDSGEVVLTPFERALTWAEDIRTRPLDDDQATALAEVYAILALTQAVNSGMMELREILGTGGAGGPARVEEGDGE